MVYESNSATDTFNIAKQLSKSSRPGDIYALSGDLGAGKTVFAKGFAAGLGINCTVTSPTFTILNEYQGGRLALYHMDAYRITESSGMDDTGYEEYLYGDGVCLVEWADAIADIIPQGSIWISIEKDPVKPDEYRRIIIQPRKEP